MPRVNGSCRRLHQSGAEALEFYGALIVAAALATATLHRSGAEALEFCGGPATTGQRPRLRTIDHLPSWYLTRSPTSTASQNS